jgi:hypothetical protein
LHCFVLIGEANMNADTILELKTAGHLELVHLVRDFLFSARSYGKIVGCLLFVQQFRLFPKYSFQMN